MPTPSAEDQRPSARLTSLFPSGMSDGKAEREAGRVTERKRKQARRKRRTKRQSEIEQRDSPPAFGAHLEKLSYDSQL